MVRNQKMTDAAFRTIELLKLLKYKPMNLNELFFYFQEKYPDTIDTKETILKYINTLRYFGFEIKKFQNSYHISDNFLRVDFSEDELQTLLEVDEYINKFAPDDVKSEFAELMQNIQSIFSEKTYDILQKVKNNYSKKFNLDFSNNEEKIQKLSSYIKDNLKLKIEYKNYDGVVLSVIAEPVSLIYKQDKIFLSIFNQLKGQLQELFIDNIINITQLPQKVSNAGISKAITFKVFGRLRLKYRLRKSEKIIEQNDDYMVILNKFEDKDLFLRRMLRYQDACEIMYPLEVKNAFLNLIDSTLAIYSA